MMSHRNLILNDMPDVEVKHDGLLSAVSTFRLGGPCQTLVSCASEEALVHAVRALRGESFVLIGGGSNILFSDQGYAGCLLRYAAEVPAIQREGNRLHVGGATTLDDLAAYSVEAGLGGLINTSGIPGTVGGAVVGNAGAWGWQMGDAVESVRLVDREGVVREAVANELNFAYRDSRLKYGKEIVVSVCLVLPEEEPEALRLRREEILLLRKQKHPDLALQPCIGSIFKNLEPTSAAERRQAAGFFLEQVGAKDMCVGGAEVFDRHANIIVKGAGCTAQDVHDLSLMMSGAVASKLDLSLQREVRFLGVFDGAAASDGFF